MARPKKNNADYFSHDNNMRNHRKIKAIRARFGIQGYAMFCMMLESLTAADYLQINYTDLEIEFLAGDFGVEYKLLKQFIEYCLSIDIFQVKTGKLCSAGLKYRLNELFEKRAKDRKRKQKDFPVENYGKQKNTNNETVFHMENSRTEQKAKKNNLGVKKDDNQAVFKEKHNDSNHPSCGVVCTDEVVFHMENPTKEKKRKEKKINKNVVPYSNNTVSSNNEEKTEKPGDGVFYLSPETLQKINSLSNCNEDFINTVYRSLKQNEQHSLNIVNSMIQEQANGYVHENPAAYFNYMFKKTPDTNYSFIENDWKTVVEISKSSSLQRNELMNKLSEKGKRAYFSIAKYIREMRPNFTVFYSDTGIINVKSEFIKNWKEAV